MDHKKHVITKFVAKTVVITTVGSAVTKALLATFPQTAKLNIAEITGSVGGFIAGNKLEPYTDQAVDDFYEWREARQSKKN